MIIKIPQEYLDNEMKKVKAHPASYNIFRNKSEIIPLKIFDIPAPAANIIKQEMLSLGGDAVVHKNAVNCCVEKSDIILLGTVKQYNFFMEKLKKMPYFSLDKVRIMLRQYFSAKKPDSIKSPWGRALALDRTRVMGIINVSPDSFYVGSCKQNIEKILSTCQIMIQDGADILDISGISNYPGSDSTRTEEEQKGIVTAVKTIRENYSHIMISANTCSGNAAKKALEAGADIISDVSGFDLNDKLAEVIAQSGTPCILTHTKGITENIQTTPTYDDLLREIMQYFTDKIQYTSSFNIDENNIIINPGLGFGKTCEDNMEILDRMQELKSLHKPLLIDTSGKPFAHKTSTLESDEREGALAIAALCAHQNIDIVRVNDVKAAVGVIKKIEAIKCRRTK